MERVNETWGYTVTEIYIHQIIDSTDYGYVKSFRSEGDWWSAMIDGFPPEYLFQAIF